MRAILIDDEPLALQGLKLELEKTGQVIVDGLFDDANHALEYLGSNRPDVVFMDIEMPVINGLELFEKITDLQPEMQIVFVTAYREYAVEAFELQSVDYLVKPVQADRLADTLKRLSIQVPKDVDYRLDIRCFGHFSILHDGEDINLNWRTRKAEELIAYLISHLGGYVAKEKIADALWPELDGDKSMANLYLAHYYIRKQNQVSEFTIPVESARGKMRFNFSDVHCDLVQFAQLARSLETVNHENILAAEEALSMSAREPFEDSYYPWVIDFQQNFQRIRHPLECKVKTYHQNAENTKNGERHTISGETFSE